MFFSVIFAAISTVSVTKETLDVMVKRVQELFNQKYSEYFFWLMKKIMKFKIKKKKLGRLLLGMIGETWHLKFDSWLYGTLAGYSVETCNLYITF